MPTGRQLVDRYSRSHLEVDNFGIAKNDRGDVVGKVVVFRSSFYGSLLQVGGGSSASIAITAVMRMRCVSVSMDGNSTEPAL